MSFSPINSSKFKHFCLPEAMRAYFLIIALFGAFAYRVASGADASICYSNPLPFLYESNNQTHSELRDPCIIRDGSTYYVVFTMWPFRPRDEKHFAEPDMGSSPGIRLYSTQDFKNWKDEGWIVKSSDLPPDCPYKHQFWAPEIHHYNGKYYVIFTASNWNAQQYHLKSGYYAFIGVADKVTGPYQHITQVPNGPCDTTLFTDDSGQFYLAMPRGDISVQKVDLDQLEEGIVTRLGPEVTVVRHDGSDIQEAVSPKYLEGPWVEHVGAKYYLFYAAFYGSGGYWTGVASSDNPMGPYIKDPRGKVFFGGHLAVFDGPDGRKWFSYRGERDSRVRGRLAIDPIDIDGNGRIQASDTIETPVNVPIKN
jgi:xylan 1,4-beta-xylosidase